MRFEALDTITIVPEHEFDLGGQCGEILSAGNADRLFVPKKDGTILVLDSSLSLVSQFPLENGHWLGKVSNSGQWMVLGNREGFQIRTLDGTKLYEEKTPVFQIEDFLFSAEDDRLWTIRHTDFGRVRLESRNTVDWQVERSAVFDEPTSHTGFFLYLHPEKKVIAIWAAAGQDGQWIYWAMDDGATIHIHQTEVSECSPPWFHPTGAEFLTTQGSNLIRFGFPECDELDWLLGEDVDVDLDESHNMVEACYLSDSHVLFGTNVGRLFLASVDPMEITHELVIAGHEPCPDPNEDPWLDEEEYEEGLFADFDTFYLFGDKIVCVHWNEHWRSPEKTHRLSIWSKPAICGPSSQPDPAAPFTAKFLEQLS